MRSVFHRSFDKQYKKLPEAQKKRFEKAVALFESEPYHPDLYNHPLTGKWRGHRSIAFGGNWRAHYVPEDESIALFVAIGTHPQLYK